jgi:pimeloyl-ACP methyl ester carboxylesterase
MAVWMNRYAQTGGRKFRKVRYPNIPSPRNAAKGVVALDAALHRTDGPVIVFGHSMGAQIASKWLREYGGHSSIDPARVTFLLCGNPERKYGGALCVPSTPRYLGMKVQPSYGGPGIPDDTRYTVLDYSRQYDWWSDAATSVSPAKAAVANMSQAIHCDYFRVGLNDPDVRSYTEGTRTYLLKPTALSATKRAAVETSYRRPGALQT